MKKIIKLCHKLLSLLFILNTIILSSQISQGKITYERIYNDTEERRQLEDPNLDIAERKKIEEGIIMSKKFIEKTFFLEFNTMESIYKPEEVLNLKPSGVDEFPFTDYYKNFQENYFMWKFDGFGAQLIIKDSMRVFNWKLSNVSKKIGKYNCHKAYFTENRISGSERVEKEDGSFETVMEHKDFVFTAWYTMEIPVSNGPDRYGGLPGLILEVDEAGGQKIVATEITLNQDKPLNIKIPKGDDVVSFKEFEEKMGFSPE